MRGRGPTNLGADDAYQASGRRHSGSLSPEARAALNLTYAVVGDDGFSHKGYIVPSEAMNSRARALSSLLASFEHFWQGAAKPGHRLRQYDPILRQQPADLVKAPSTRI